ncbi:MAG: UDP-2,3-diacylglucosamine diphosphatase [Bacteroidales bacterium]|nr:UDP-2,3-diacylglucosamine diphosphatase [Bacteroidales bacterium]
MIYFVADIHLGLKAGPEGPAEREERFASWLRSLLKPDTEEIWLLGDIWDFWYEYRDVMPREAIRVTAALIDLLDSGVKIHYIPGNHDVWLYSFWQELGVDVRPQPQTLEVAGKRLVVGHGDGLGGAKWGYRMMLRIFHSKVCQALFSALHPWLGYRFGTDWSNSNRRKHGGYRFRGEQEPLWRWCGAEAEKAAAAGTPVDCFIFGHFHDAVDMPVSGSRLIVLKDWIGGGVHFAALSPDGTLSVC